MTKLIDADELLKDIEKMQFSELSLNALRFVIGKQPTTTDNDAVSIRAVKKYLAYTGSSWDDDNTSRLELINFINSLPAVSVGATGNPVTDKQPTLESMIDSWWQAHTKDIGPIILRRALNHIVAELRNSKGGA